MKNGTLLFERYAPFLETGAFTTVTASTSLDITGSTGLILENDETITNSTDGTVLINGIIKGGSGSADPEDIFDPSAETSRDPRKMPGLRLEADPLAAPFVPSTKAMRQLKNERPQLDDYILPF